MAYVRAERNALSFDFGRQLRKLHAVEVDAFGLMPPDPVSINQSTFAAWIDRETSRAGQAAELAGMGRDTLQQIIDIYAMLREEYHDRPRLCHGDCTATNILVNQGRVAALIDWEWARGGDPATDIAFWAFWQDDVEGIDALLAGYQAGDSAGFRRRVLAYRVYTAVDLIHVYAEDGGPDDIRFCRQKLEAAIETRSWATR
jgi:aminoglycoside phosphotransferase (APT) family kinase protein